MKKGLCKLFSHWALHSLGTALNKYTDTISDFRGKGIVKFSATFKSLLLAIFRCKGGIF